MSTDDHDPSTSGDARLPADDHRDPVSGPSDDDLMAMALQGAAQLDQADHDHIAGLWEGIAAAIAAEPRAPAGVTDEGTAPSPAPTTAPSLGIDGRAERRPPDHAATRRPARRRGEVRRARRSSMVDLSEARQRRAVGRVLGGIAAVLLVVVGISWATTRTEPTAPLASFRMDALDERAPEPVSGEVVDTDAGRRVQVDLATLPSAPSGTFYELWLLDADTGQLVSLGPVEQQDSFAVPAAVDLADYPLIDVSIEPADGDPTHSSDSVLRGAVVAASPAG